MSHWERRGKSVADLIEELRSFEDPDREVRISVDGGDRSVPISLVGKVGTKYALLMNCEDVPSIVEHWPDEAPTGPDFPVAGGIFVALEDFPALLLVQWRAPVTTDIPFTLVAGTRIRIDADTRGRPSAVYAQPVDYKAVEKAAIPWWTRWRPDYAGYTLCLRTRDLVRHFQSADGRESIPE